MDSNNPYQSPHSDLIDPGLERGPSNVPLVPWEDKAAFPNVLARVLETMKLMFRPAVAGASLGLHKRIGPAISYFLCVGLPMVWLMQIVVAVLGPADPNAAMLERFNIPHAAPMPGMEQLQKTIQLVVALLMPVGMAIGMAVMGFVFHGGLWMVRALKPGRGLETTFRTMLYAYGSFNAVLWVFNVWVFLPFWAGMGVLALSILLSLAFFVWQGILLAKAHDTNVWRGVLGVFLPWIILGCCCGGLLGALGGLAAFAARAR